MALYQRVKMTIELNTTTPMQKKPEEGDCSRLKIEGGNYSMKRKKSKGKEENNSRKGPKSKDKNDKRINGNFRKREKPKINACKE